MLQITDEKTLIRYISLNPVLSGMNPEEMKVFGMKAKSLIEDGCLTVFKLDLLGIYSSLVVEYFEISDELSRSGYTLTLTGTDGSERVIANPLFKMKRDIVSDIRVIDTFLKGHSESVKKSQ